MTVASASPPRSPRVGVIVVMPQGDPFGLEFDCRNATRMWDTLYTRRLIPCVDAHYRTLADRSYRAIAGLSGGGVSAPHAPQRLAAR